MTTFVFDFDGTLADSLLAIVTITNRLAPEFGYRATPLEEVDALKGLTARQLIRYSGIPVFKIPALLRRVKADLQQQSTQIKPCRGMPEVIRKLHAQQHTLAIVTSNTPKVVRPFLAAHKLEECFIAIEGGGTLFRKGKLITKCLAQHQLSPDTAVYVGDEVRDIQAARAAGVRPIAVTWGFNTSEALAAADPDWLIDEPTALQDIARSLAKQ